jgi:hypothetical protein
VFWLDGAPSPEVDGLDEATRAEFAKWWALYISAWNPEPRHGAHRMDEIAAIALPVDGQENRVSHLSGILNRVQRHQCSEAYCLRKGKDTSNVYCRFHFPWPLRDEPDLAKPAFSKFYRLHPCRNDPNLNCYNRLMSMAWLANTDVNPCTGSRTVLEYIAKYVSKPEKKTGTYKEIMQRILPSINSNNPILSAVSKLMNQLVGERDWSAQEVSHLLLDLPLVNTSRQFVNVDLRPEDERAMTFVFGDNGDGSEDTVRQGLSPLEKYKRCDEELGDVTYLKFLLRFNIQSASNIYELRPGTPSRVLVYFPEYKRERPEQEEDYCRVKMMLHHPFRDVEDLKLVGSIAGQPWGTFKEAYTHCESNHHHEDDHYDVPGPPEPDAPPDDEPNAPDDEIRQAWMEMAGHLPQRDGTRVEGPNALGRGIWIEGMTGIFGLRVILGY